MSVNDGQDVNAAVTNAAYISRKTDSDTIAKVDLKDTATTDLIDIQRVTNEVLDASGVANQAATDVTAKVYSSNNVIADGDNRKTAIGKIDGTFDTTTGHDHDGANSKALDAGNLDNMNLFFAEFQDQISDSANGNSIDVSADFAAKSPGGDASTKGVVTSNPLNYITMIEKVNGGEVEDSSGRRVYARLTEAAGVWTLTFYVNITGTETAHSLSSQDIKYLYREVFDQSDRPTLGANVAVFDTMSAVGDIPAASTTQEGKVTTGTQTFGGDKDFNDALKRGGVDIVDKTTAEDVSNKAIIDPSRLDVKKDTLANLTTYASSASNGQLCFSTDTLETFVVHTSALQAIGGGGAGGGGLDVYYSEDFSETVAADYSTGNNATFLNGGTLDGTLADETTNPISGSSSLKYTMGATSTNDWVSSPIIDIDNKQKENRTVFRLYAEYDGDAGDIVFVFWDQTNSEILTSTLDVVESITKSQRYEFEVYIPDSTTQVRWGFQVVTGNNTKILLTDDIEFTTNPADAKNLSNDTEWKAFTMGISASTPPTKGTIVRDLAWWRRVGDSMEVRYDFEQSAGGSAGTGTYEFQLPAGYLMDLNKVDLTNEGENTVGICKGSNDAGAEAATTYTGTVVARKTNAVAFSLMSTSSLPAFAGSGLFPLSGGPVLYSASFTVPIEGWLATSEYIVTPATSSGSNWIDYTPVLGNFGAATGTDFKWRRVLGSIEIQGKFTAGTTVASEAQIGLPTVPDTLTINSTVMATIKNVGDIVRSTSTTNQWNVTGTGGDTYLNVAEENTGGGLTPVNANTLASSGQTLSFYASIPIEGWDANATFLAAVPTQQTCYIKDIKPNNTLSGTSTATYTARNLNTLSGDTWFCSLGSDQFTLQPGKYDISVIAPAVEAVQHKALLYDVTNSSNEILGSSEVTSSSTTVSTCSKIEGQITIATPTTFEIRHRVASTLVGNGWGFRSNFGESEVYTQVKITKAR